MTSASLWLTCHLWMIIHGVVTGNHGLWRLQPYMLWLRPQPLQAMDHSSSRGSHRKAVMDGTLMVPKKEETRVRMRLQNLTSFLTIINHKVYNSYQHHYRGLTLTQPSVDP